MRKLSLSAIAMFFQVLSAFSQADSGTYKERKLHVDEVNFITGYYVQDGDKAAVTGGVGSQALTDVVNTLEVKLVKKDKLGRQHDFSIEAGFDHYTSASSDKVDPSTISSASSADGRFYTTLAYKRTNPAKTMIGGGFASYSIESDYQSYSVGGNFTKVSKDKNTEVSAKLQAYFDFMNAIYAIELRSAYGDGNVLTRNTYNATLSYSRVVNQRLQASLTFDPAYQAGQLATTFQRVYITNGAVRPETLPDKRTKLPLGIRAAYFMGDRVILRFLYRFYTDDWGITGHTTSLEVPVKISPVISAGPVYRYHTQTGADYFAPFKAHVLSDKFYTSDYDLGKFDAHFIGINLRLTPPNGILGITHFRMLEIRYGHYLQSTGLFADLVSLNARFK